MISQQDTVQAGFKAPQPLRVRFAHAPCVKLTLQTRLDTLAASIRGRMLNVRQPAGMATATR